jgi:hypothetical protein
MLQKGDILKYCVEFWRPCRYPSRRRKPAEDRFRQATLPPFLHPSGDFMKQLKRKALYGALVQALGAGVACRSLRQARQPNRPKRSRNRVTGSNIKRIDMETVAPGRDHHP